MNQVMRWFMRAVDALVDQTRAIEKAVNAMNLNALVFEGSDSLDQPSVVQ